MRHPILEAIAAAFINRRTRMLTDPAAPAPSITAAPSRNVLYGAVVGIISAAILAELRRLGLGDWLLPEIVAGIPTVVGFIVAYFIPMSQQDVADRTSNHTVTLANLDQDNPTTAKIVPEAESDAITKTAMIVGAVPPNLAAKLEPAKG